MLNFCLAANIMLMNDTCHRCRSLTRWDYHFSLKTAKNCYRCWSKNTADASSLLSSMSLRAPMGLYISYSAQQAQQAQQMEFFGNYTTSPCLLSHYVSPDLYLTRMNYSLMTVNGTRRSSRRRSLCWEKRGIRLSGPGDASICQNAFWTAHGAC